MNTSETQNLCGLKREDFQTTINGKNTDLYILRNNQGCEVAVTNYGGAVLAIMVPDKDIDTVMGMLPEHAVYYWTQASTHRAIPVQRVAEKALAHQLHGTTYCNVEAAYRHALADSTPDDFIFVGGSSYVVADLLAIHP